MSVGSMCAGDGDVHLAQARTPRSLTSGLTGKVVIWLWLNLYDMQMRMLPKLKHFTQ